MAEAQAAEVELAKKEAELIQAEAKARARVDGEASILTSQAMEGATASYEMTLRLEKDLQIRIDATQAKIALVMSQRASTQTQLDSSSAKLALQVKASTE